MSRCRYLRKSVNEFSYGNTVENVHRNMILSHYGKPSKYLPWCMIIWGILSVCTGASLLKVFWLYTKTFSRQVLQPSSYLHLEFHYSHNLTKAISAFYVHGSPLDLWKQHFFLELWWDFIGFISLLSIFRPSLVSHLEMVQTA